MVLVMIPGIVNIRHGQETGSLLQDFSLLQYLASDLG
jgi:hypothetical protein